MATNLYLYVTATTIYIHVVSGYMVKLTIVQRLTTWAPLYIDTRCVSLFEDCESGGDATGPTCRVLVFLLEYDITRPSSIVIFSFYPEAPTTRTEVSCNYYIKLGQGSANLESLRSR